MTPGKQFVELDKSRHDRQSFDCGEAQLNTFLKQYALRHRKAGISKTMVLPAEATAKPFPICAFYTLSHTEIARASLPTESSKRLPQYPVPVMLLAQLAVARNCQGQHLGEVTLITALKEALAINRHLPSFAVVVDSIAPEVQRFYEQYGFAPLGEHQGRMRLFLPMKTIEKLFGE